MNERNYGRNGAVPGRQGLEVPQLRSPARGREGPEDLPGLQAPAVLLRGAGRQLLAGGWRARYRAECLGGALPPALSDTPGAGRFAGVGSRLGHGGSPGAGHYTCRQVACSEHEGRGPLPMGRRALFVLWPSSAGELPLSVWRPLCSGANDCREICGGGTVYPLEVVGRTETRAQSCRAVILDMTPATK